MKNQEFGIWNNEIDILLNQNEAEKAIKILNQLFEYPPAPWGHQAVRRILQSSFYILDALFIHK